MLIIIRFLLLLFFTNIPYKSLAHTKSKYRQFAYIKVSKANLRKGDSVDYDIVFVYNKKRTPIEVIHSKEYWVYVKDRNGNKGWIKKSMLSFKKHRFALAKYEKVTLYRLPVMKGSNNGKNKKIAIINKDIPIEILSCDINNCRVKIIEESITGWVDRRHLWGIDIAEIL